MVRIGVEPAGKQDEYERSDANSLSELKVGEVDTAEALGASEHADTDEQQKHRNAKAACQLARTNGDQQEHCDDRQRGFNSCHRFGPSAIRSHV